MIAICENSEMAQPSYRLCVRHVKGTAVWRSEPRTYAMCLEDAADCEEYDGTTGKPFRYRYWIEPIVVNEEGWTHKS